MTILSQMVNLELINARDRLMRRCLSTEVKGKYAWRRYAALIEGNFLTWLMAAYLRCTGEESRRALLPNIEEEVIDNHPNLLRQLLLRYDLLPDVTAHVSATEVLGEIRFLCATGSPISLLAMLTYLELCSPQFLPVLADSADVSVQDPYIAVHLKSDCLHAALLERALVNELLSAPNPEQILARGIDLGENLLAVVFGWEIIRCS